MRDYLWHLQIKIKYINQPKIDPMNKLKIITGSIASLCFTASCASYYCAKPTTINKVQIKTESNFYKHRKDHLSEMINRPQYDVVVIGGGCNGVGVLLDATTRGLRTLLIQKDDFASGASSKSTKLIHGGVRYLQQVFELSTDSISSRLQKFKLVKQAITQRSMMIDSAPHLTTKTPFVIPCSNMFTAIYYYAGSMMYYMIYKYYAPDTKTKFNAPYFMNRSELTQIFPYINPKYSMGVVYEDGAFNDARMLIAALLTATVGNGIKMPEKFLPGNVLNRAEFQDFIKDNDGKIVGVKFKDGLTQKTYDVKAKYVVNCTGSYADKLRLKDNPEANRRIIPVAGSHITYDSKIASGSFGLCVPSSDQRVILVHPWLNRVIAGTTETSLDQPTNNPKCSDQQRKFINSEMMSYMSELSVEKFMQYEKTRWCGIRPLVAENANSQTKKISRGHVVEKSKSGLYSLMGGKWTIYRLMGEDIVDRICEQQKQKGNIYPATQTKNLPLIGFTSSDTVFTKLLKQKQDIGAHLYYTFGKQAQQVSKGNLIRLYGSTSLAQLQWIVKNQLVTDIEDVLMRRTRLCFVMGKRESLALAQIIGQLLQRQHGWSDKERDRRVAESIARIVQYEFQ